MSYLCSLYRHNIGFIPVIYALIANKYSSKSVQLPAEEESTSEATLDSDGKVSKQLRPLTGWTILLMWIPAVCDLTGTVVSILCYIPLLRLPGQQSYSIHLIAHDDWPAIYSCIHLPNDSRRASSVGWPLLSHVLATQTVALPVSTDILSKSFALCSTILSADGSHCSQSCLVFRLLVCPALWRRTLGKATPSLL